MTIYFFIIQDDFWRFEIWQKIIARAINNNNNYNFYIINNFFTIISPLQSAL